jgi:hypothetical protein
MHRSRDKKEIIGLRSLHLVQQSLTEKDAGKKKRKKRKKERILKVKIQFDTLWSPDDTLSTSRQHAL